jgi:hypothetical protein
MAKKPLITSLSMSFRKATVPETVEEAKKEHRQKLHSLVEQYAQDVLEGKAEGIRNAKELVEVMKMDMLLMGEATDRTENTNNIDEVRISKMSQYVSDDDPALLAIMEQMLMGLNNANDEEDIGSSKKQLDIAKAERARFDADTEPVVDYERIQEEMSSEDTK